MTQFKSIKAIALERANSVETSTIITYILMATTFINIHAIVTTGRKSISVMAIALKTSVQICAFPISTNSFSFVTFVNILKI